MLSDDEKLDASSRFQESLPVSSDELMRRLDEWGVIYKCFNHVPLSTVADSKLIQHQFLNKSEGGGLQSLGDGSAWGDRTSGDPQPHPAGALRVGF